MPSMVMVALSLPYSPLMVRIPPGIVVDRDLITIFAPLLSY